MSKWKEGAFVVFICAALTLILGYFRWYYFYPSVEASRSVHVELLGPPDAVGVLLDNSASRSRIRKHVHANLNLLHDYERNGMSLISEAAAKGRDDVVEDLLDLGADPNGNQLGDFDNPLANAIMAEEAITAQILLSRGADPFRPAFLGESAYEKARRSENDDIQDLLRLMESAAQEDSARDTRPEAEK